jgi:hypothetical protein
MIDVEVLSKKSKILPDEGGDECRGEKDVHAGPGPAGNSFREAKKDTAKTGDKQPDGILHFPP